MIRTVVWKTLDGSSMEFCNLSFEKQMSIEGKIINASENSRSLIEYLVQCDREDKTNRVQIHYKSDRGTQSLELLRDHKDRWSLNGDMTDKLTGIQDIDVGVTPSTNLLPIRRVHLQVRESALVTAAWVKFPEMKVVPLKQNYKRLDENTYQYSSVESGYTARLTFDSEGILSEYEGEWVRI